MPNTKTDLLPGTLDLLILRTLNLGTNHGLAIARRLLRISKQTFDVKPGSLFPALHRLEQRGWLDAEWGTADDNRRVKYYRLTTAGRRHLGKETVNWERIASAIQSAIEATS
jgi:PadR family transcriptional regulator PadR